jgi:branched-chain amino acid transport system permease protein
MMNLRVAAHRQLHRLWRWYALLAATALAMLAGFAALIEMIYAMQFGAGGATTLSYLGLPLDTGSATSWAGAAVAAAFGFVTFEAVRRRFAREWGSVQSDIEAAMTFKEPA